MHSSIDHEKAFVSPVPQEQAAGIFDQPQPDHSALGFSVLGFVPLIYKTCSAVRNCSAENASTLIGSGSSILVGATFLVAAYSFRRVRSGSRRLIEPIDADMI